MSRNFLMSICFILIFLGPGLQAQETDLISGELIVRLAPQVKATDFIRNLSNQRAPGVAIKRSLGRLHNIHLLQFDPQQIEGEVLLQKVRENAQVITAQLNYTVDFRTDPNDDYYPEQWDMVKIGLPDVWETTTGGVTINGDTIVVAILDSGFDINHPDLRDNIWQNLGEIPNDGIDNDGNNYIDDNFAWNFRDTSNQHNIHSHGHSVAGIIGARGNNGLGVTGVNWQVKLMVLDTKAISDIIEAYEYVIDQRSRYNASNGAEGAFVVATNASFGKDRAFCDDYPVWRDMYDLMGEVGILTGAGTANSNWNVEEMGDMPTTCPTDYLITVLNTNEADKKHSGSAYGPVSIDLGSPGQGTFTIALNDDYGEFGGNSAAAPHLSGAIAMLYSIPCPTIADGAILQPAQTALFIRQMILQGVDPISELLGLTVTSGRLNVFNSLQLIQKECGGTTGDLDILNIYPNPVSDHLFVEFETPDFEDYFVRIYNALGQLVYRNTITPPRFGQKKFDIETRGWAQGIYFLSLEKGKQRINRSFVVGY
ncbi:MAG: hypothetical protein DHS20C18_37590 [Saprospiraceae bacterium]|nr:MAG: hypothetical protein DHS20C18_37590 [Saprospiraceae bacterium]